MSIISPSYLSGSLSSSLLRLPEGEPFLSAHPFMMDLAFDHNQHGRAMDDFGTIFKLYESEATHQFLTASCRRQAVWDPIGLHYHYNTVDQSARLGLIKDNSEGKPFGVDAIYWEFLCYGGVFWKIGLCNASFDIHSSTVGVGRDPEGNSICWESFYQNGEYSRWVYKGVQHVNLVSLSDGKPGIQPGDVVMFAWNKTTQRIFLGIRRSGTHVLDWMAGDPTDPGERGLPFPPATLTGDLYPAITINGTNEYPTSYISINTTATWQYVPPGYMGATLSAPISGTFSPSYLSGTLEVQ